MDTVCFLLFCLSLLFCCLRGFCVCFMCLRYEPENHSDRQGAVQADEHSVVSLQNLTSLQIRGFRSLNPRIYNPTSRKYLVYKHACILILSATYLRNIGGDCLWNMVCLKVAPHKSHLSDFHHLRCSKF